MDYEKRLQIEVQILSAYIIEDVIGWTKDPECRGSNFQEIVDTAIQVADTLIERSAAAQRRRHSKDTK